MVWTLVVRFFFPFSSLVLQRRLVQRNCLLAGHFLSKQVKSTQWVWKKPWIERGRGKKKKTESVPLWGPPEKRGGGKIKIKLARKIQIYWLKYGNAVSAGGLLFPFFLLFHSKLRNVSALSKGKGGKEWKRVLGGRGNETDLILNS